ncbi:hypothetical protein HDU98_006067 [Podochytrium sp. JEL0797]|nr:hypothetical protein HDU98_006067 [Podochytrium sp. JEL0797]
MSNPSTLAISIYTIAYHQPGNMSGSTPIPLQIQSQILSRFKSTKIETYKGRAIEILDEVYLEVGVPGLSGVKEGMQGVVGLCEGVVGLLEALRPCHLQIPLTKVAPWKPLLAGPEAAALIGDATRADTILQPSNGEFIAAHRAYLIRSPYFAPHQSFTAHQDESEEATVKITPTHPTEVRFLLQCIYVYTPEYCNGAIRKQNFLPLLLNAQFFLEVLKLSNSTTSTAN